MLSCGNGSPSGIKSQGCTCTSLSVGALSYLDELSSQFLDAVMDNQFSFVGNVGSLDVLSACTRSHDGSLQ